MPEEPIGVVVTERREDSEFWLRAAHRQCCCAERADLTAACGRARPEASIRVRLAACQPNAVVAGPAVRSVATSVEEELRVVVSRVCQPKPVASPRGIYRVRVELFCRI